MAKLGIALGSGPRGLGFESRHSDQNRKNAEISKGFRRFPFPWLRAWFYSAIWNYQKRTTVNYRRPFFIPSWIISGQLYGKKADFSLFPSFIGSFESNSPKRPFSGVIWAGNEKRCRNDKGAILYIPAANWQAYGESIKSRFLPEQALANIRIV